jgi:hydroxymethylglutaryl-CoA reductase
MSGPVGARGRRVMSNESLLSGLYKVGLAERRQRVADYGGFEVSELALALDHGGLDPTTADKVVENVLGTYALPFGVAPHFLVNGRERLAAMVVEEPSVIAAASSAAQRIKKSGGFVATMLEDLMTAQIEVHHVGAPNKGARTILKERAALLEQAALAVPGLVARGGGPRELEVRLPGPGLVVVHIHVDCRDAMGANLVSGIAEALGPRVAELAGGTLGLRILTNLCDHRRVEAHCEVALSALGDEQRDGAEVAERIEQASHFAEIDVYRAVTHNKGLMNGLDSVLLATGNDLRAVEAGAHAFAARSGTYRPLSLWSRQGKVLCGRVELALSVGIVGGTIAVHPAARLALRIMKIESASDLATLAASVGLASNLAALRALSTDGIQRGHMALHARSVAVQAGATGSLVEAVASELVARGRINVEAARELLERLGKGSK